MRDKQIVVTGGAGRIGRHVVRELLEAGLPVRVADLRPADDDVDFQACDVTRIDDARAALRDAAAVCHLAGLDHDTGAEPDEFVRVNATGTWNVLQAAAEHGVTRAVVASSSAAYGLFDLDPRWTPLYLPIDEHHPYRPHRAYALSKVVTEEVAATWARTSGMSVVCLQPLHVVGPETLADFDAFVAAAEPRWPHNYVAVQDVARAFRLALAADVRGCEAVLIGAEDSPLDEPTLSWYARGFGRLPELREPWLYRSTPRASVFSIAKARDLLGWTPRLRLDDVRRLASEG